MITMEINEPFPCARCGECCRHIDRVPMLAEFDTGSGVCRHLNGDLCDIYEDRPEVCRVDVMYERYFKEQYSREEFHSINKRVCDELRGAGNK